MVDARGGIGLGALGTGITGSGIIDSPKVALNLMLKTYNIRMSSVKYMYNYFLPIINRAETLGISYVRHFNRCFFQSIHWRGHSFSRRMRAMPRAIVAGRVIDSTRTIKHME